MKYKFKNPQTGAIGEIAADHVSEAMSDGMQPVEPIAMFNPHTKGSGSISQDRIQEALTDGLIPMGSTAERAAQMGGLEAGARKLASGASMGFSDEIAGALKSIIGDQPYEQARDEYRQGDNAASEALPPGVGTALEIGGGLASSFIPVAGPLGKIFGAAGKGLQAGSKAAIARSALQGAAGGLGYSNADLTKGDFQGAATDTALGAGLGAGVESVLPRAASYLKNALSKAKGIVADTLDPGVQRAIAAGASGKELRAPMRTRTLDASKELQDIGLFDSGDLKQVLTDPEGGVRLVFNKATGGLPDKKALDSRLTEVMPVLGKQIGDLYKRATANGAQINVYDDVLGKTADQLNNIVKNATPGSERSIDDAVMTWLSRMESAKDNVGELFHIKDSLVNTAKFNTVQGKKNELAQVATMFYGTLTEALTKELDKVATESGDAALSALNKKYAAAANFKQMLDSGIAAEEKQQKTFGFLKGSAKAGGLGAAIGAGIGGAPGAAVGATAGQALDQMAASTEGRLARAALGDKLAARFGKVPRSSQAVRTAIESNPDQFVPLIGPQMMQAIHSMPAKVWEEQSRVLMPILDQAGVFEHSEYPSELDGKIAGQDKLVATSQLEQMKLSPSAAAMRQSDLNARGQLPPEMMPQTADDILKRISPEAYAQRLQQMGY